MNLKKMLQLNKKTSDIPQLQSRILNELGVVHETSTSKRSLSRLVFQLTTLILIMSSALIFGFQEVSNNIYAFEAYDEVLMTATSTAYQVYDLYQNDTTNQTMSSQDVIVGELPYMVRYFRMFEAILSTQKAFELQKEEIDEGTNYSFEWMDMTSNVRRINMMIQKDMMNARKDEFKFNGFVGVEFQVSGSTTFDGSSHALRLSFTANLMTFEFDYQDNTKTYQLRVINEQTTVLDITFELAYDAYNIPTLSIHYERNGIIGDIDIVRSFRLRGFHIEYSINDGDFYEGDIELMYMKMMRQYLLRVIESDGTSYQYTYDRPEFIQDEHMNM